MAGQAMTEPSVPFAGIVSAECGVLERFIALLERERVMLLAGTVDELPRVVDEKNSLAGQLAAMGKRRAQILASAGLSGENSALTAWLQTQPAETSAAPAWSALLKLAGQARDLNSANGELIRVRLQNNTQALETLLGNAGLLKLYGPDGQSRQQGSGRISFSV